MQVYGLRNCDTVRRAMKELAAAGVAATLVDVRESRLHTDDIERFFNEFGDALVNRRSTTWRGLSEEERAGDPVALIAAYPALMKRPVIEGEGQLTLGWDKAARAVWLGNGA